MARDYRGNVWFDIHAKEHASAEELIALGKVLEAWKASFCDAKIHGLDSLLQGRYPDASDSCLLTPDPQGEIVLGDGRRFSIPIESRYAVVTIHERVLSESDLRRSLQAAIPASLGWVQEPSFNY